MKLCKNCKKFRHSRCMCRENLQERFNPIYGLSYKVKDVDFETTANKDGDCLWYEKKKWKFWVRNTKMRFQNNSLDLFLTFIREKYPEIAMEYYLRGGGEVTGVISSNRPKPTPNPTGGALRTSIL